MTLGSLRIVWRNLAAFKNKAHVKGTAAETAFEWRLA